MCRRLWDPADSLIVYYAVVDLLIANPLSSVRLGYLAFTRVQIPPMEFFHFFSGFFPGSRCFMYSSFFSPSTKGKGCSQKQHGQREKNLNRRVPMDSLPIYRTCIDRAYSSLLDNLVHWMRIQGHSLESVPAPVPVPVTHLTSTSEHAVKLFSKADQDVDQ
jgi:hypothetical protein